MFKVLLKLPELRASKKNCLVAKSSDILFLHYVSLSLVSRHLLMPSEPSCHLGRACSPLASGEWPWQAVGGGAPHPRVPCTCLWQEISLVRFTSRLGKMLSLADIGVVTVQFPNSVNVYRWQDTQSGSVASPAVLVHTTRDLRKVSPGARSAAAQMAFLPVQFDAWAHTRRSPVGSPGLMMQE